jgi:perosamine synthetase
MRIGRVIRCAALATYLPGILNGLQGLIRGKSEIERLGLEVKEYLGVKYCFFVSSGKAGLTLILQVLHRLQAGRNEVFRPFAANR